MAATKASRPKAKERKKPTKRQSSAVGKPSARKRDSSSKAKRSPKRAKSGSRSPNGVADGAKAVRETVGDAGQKAGHATAKAASKAKIPLIAGGAALAGAASGIAIAATRSNGGHRLGMRMPKAKVKRKDLAKAADRVASAGEQIGRLSTGFRELQGSSGSSNRGDRHQSPVEVLIHALTRRR